MKNYLIVITVIFSGFGLVAQNHKLRSDLKSESANIAERIANEPVKAFHSGQNCQQIPDCLSSKSSDWVTIVTLGSSANAYSYGYSGGQRSLLFVSPELNTITNFHRMGGSLDPGGYSGDLGYDISTDGGMTWTNMIECYVATNNAGGGYYTDAARYPNHGILNHVGNTDPDSAYVTFFAPILDGSNSPNSWGGYSYGVANIGDPTDTTKNLTTSAPGAGLFQYIPDAFCTTNTYETWVGDLNQDWSSGVVIYMNQIILNHGVWSDSEMDIVYEDTIIDCQTLDGSRPLDLKIEFAPDGLTGYLVALGDNGNVTISAGRSLYPLIYKTTDGGQTWSEQYEVAIAGPDGIGGVHYFLSDAELAELFEPPIPSRDEIEFTTAFDCDLSVDAWGNPQIAVVIGITGTVPYSIITVQTGYSDYLSIAAFLLSSIDGGETWIGYNCGRLKTFRGTFGDITEDNRICVSRNPDATKMFVSWLDTDLPGHTDNDQPDIWCRGIDLAQHSLTTVNGVDEPNNVTYNSEGMWQAYFGTAAQCIFENDGVYTIPFVYQYMNPADPTQPVLYKYIRDFSYTDGDFFGGFLAVWPSNQNVDTLSGFTTFNIASNTNWFVTDNASWLDVTPANGINNGIITATYSANSGAQRVGTITVTAANGPTQIVTVTQAGDVLPTITTDTVSNVTLTTAVCGGKVLNNGGSEVTMRGVCWNTTGNPTINDQKTINGSGNGSFISQITGLNCETNYFIRAYATNYVGTGYGNQETFQTLPCNNSSYFIPVWVSPFQPMAIFITEAIINGNNMVAGDEIGVFDVDPDNGNEICVGAGQLSEELTGGTFLEFIASMDDGTGNTNGFQSGNEMVFKLFSIEFGVVDSLVVTYPFPGFDQVFTPLGTAYVELEGTPLIIQNISMTTGWNLVSFRAYPQSLNMLEIFNPLISADQLIKVLDQDGNSIEYSPVPPPNGQWINTIGDLKVEQGYYAKITEPAVLSTEGVPATTPFEILLRSGWSMISVPCSEALSSQQILQNLIYSGKLIKVINDEGQAILHIPFPQPNGQWLFGFSSFYPDEGYFVNVNDESSMVFDCDNTLIQLDDKVLIKRMLTHFQPIYQNNPYMPMAIVLSLDQNIEPEDEIGIFDGDNCVGASIAGSGSFVTFPVSLDDPGTSEIDGFTNGNNITAKLWNYTTNLEEEAGLTFLEGYQYFQHLETYCGNIFDITLVEMNPQFENEVMLNVSPNPSKNKVFINYSIPEPGNITISLINVDGSVIRELLKSASSESKVMIELNGDEINPGVYIVKLIYEGIEKEIVAKKLVVY